MTKIWGGGGAVGYFCKVNIFLGGVGMGVVKYKIISFHFFLRLSKARYWYRSERNGQ